MLMHVSGLANHTTPIYLAVKLNEYISDDDGMQIYGNRFAYGIVRRCVSKLGDGMLAYVNTSH